MAISLTGTNAQILNAIRANAGLEYQNRIPEYTDANMHKAYTEISRYTPMWNLFVDTLINTVGLREFRNSQFENRLKPLKRGALTFGGMIEDDSINLINAEHYDPNDTNVFEQNRPDIVPQFYKVNRRDYYPITINEELLAEAMTTEGALAGYVANIMRVPEQSAEWDEYLIMKDILKQATEDGMANVQVGNVLTDPNPEASGKYLTQQLKGWYEKAKFYRNDLNINGVDTTTKNMVLITTPDIQASLQVNVLANAFHMDEAKFLADRVVMVDSFDVPGTQAYLVDEDFYRVYDELNKSTSIYNPKTLSLNYFLHVWQVIAYSRSVNAIRFSTEPTTIGAIEKPTVTSVSVRAVEPGTATAVTQFVPGDEVQIEPSVIYSNSERDKRAYMILTGSTATAPEANAETANVILPDSGTYIDELGILHVAENMSYDRLFVTAVATADPSKNATITLTKFE